MSPTSVRKATLQGGVIPVLAALEKAPAKVIEGKADDDIGRPKLATLDDEWISAVDTKDNVVSPSTAEAAAIAAGAKAPPPPPPRRAAAATIMGLTPFSASAEPPSVPASAKPVDLAPPAPSKLSVLKSLADKATSTPEKPADKPAPPKRSNATLLLGSIGAAADKPETPAPAEAEAAKLSPKPAPPTPKEKSVEALPVAKAEEPADVLRPLKSEAPGPTKVEGQETSRPSVSPIVPRGPAASALDGVSPGTTLGRYEILMPLARGGMASVWAGRMQGTRGFSRIVAIKTMLPDISDDPDFQTMFLDEARVAARIKHPNVVQIIDLGEEDEVLYLVMDWVEGETLGAVQRAAKPLGGIPLPIALRIAQQALAGLHAAHELRDDAGNLIDLVHRDVSPGNVLVSTQGFVKIVDFGIAKSKGRMHVTRAGGLVKGKTPYLSPEQLGQLPIDRRSDIFSFGCLLYVMTTGLHPFRGESELKTVENIALKAPMSPRELNPKIPVELDKIIIRTLEKDPAKRFATALELQKAIVQIGATLEATTDEDVGEFVRSVIGEAQEKRAADLKAAIASLEETGAKSLRGGATPAVGELTPQPLSPKKAAAVEAPKAAERAEPADAAESSATATALAEALAAASTERATSGDEPLPSELTGEAPASEKPADEDLDADEAAFKPRKPNLRLIVGAALGACALVGVLALATRGGSGSGASATASTVASAPPPTAAPAATAEATGASPAATAAPTAEPAPTPAPTATAAPEAPVATATAAPKATSTKPTSAGKTPVSSNNSRPATGNSKPPAKTPTAKPPKKYNPSGI